MPSPAPLPLRALFVAIGLVLAAAPAGAQETIDADLRPSKAPEERLAEAILAYERGDLGGAADGFHDVLDYPVQVRARSELHRGFLHYAYTLFLQNSKNQAAQKLKIALRLDPEYQPSPVVLRPDLYQFYQEQRDAHLAAGPALMETPQQIFPELQVKAGVGGDFPFVPIFGVGLYKLGHRDEAVAVGSAEVLALSFNAASVIMRFVAFDKRTPAGDLVRDASVAINVASFFVFWPVFITEMVATLTLQRRYTDFPELRPRVAATPRQWRAPPPVLRLGPGGLTLAFW